jgi:hypothetical protein
MLGKTILLSQTPDVFTFLHPILVCRITQWALLELLIPHLQWSSVCGPAKIFSTSNLVFFFFCNPTHKTETRTAKQTGGTLLITTHLDQSLWWAKEKYWPSDHIYYTLFCRCTVLLRPLPATPNCAILLSQNHFPTGMFWLFLHPKLLCRSHTFSTGDALRCSCKASERENQ